MEANKELLFSYINERIQDSEEFLSRESIYSEKSKRRFAFSKLEKHVNDFLNGYKENRFIIMPGLRGVGKTTLILQLYNYLLKEKNIESDRILYISVDQLNEYLNGRILDAVDVFIRDIHRKTPITLDKELFIFIDEAQNDEKWSQAGKILYDQNKKIFMIFTGSSALEFEINVDAVRRTKKEQIFPMNFQEYLLLKHNISLPKGTSEIINDMIFTGDVQNAQKREIELIKKLFKLKSPLKKEWEDYLCYGDFPANLTMRKIDINEKTYNMIERVIEKDVIHYKAVGKSTKNVISRMVTFLSLQKPGELSKNKLASKLGVSSSVIQDNLNILEKTHLIFHIKPYGSAGKIIRKPWKYYFLSPSMKANINFNLGIYGPENREFLGILSENLIASYFFRIKKTTHKPQGIFYIPEPGHADFILKKFDDEIVPVEVGIGKKTKRQVKKSMNKYNSNHGIIISDTTETIKKEEDVIYMPLTTFSLI